MLKYFRNYLVLLLIVLVAFQVVTAQQSFTKAEIESHLRFLASDELKGRETGTMGADVAARYIAEQFRRCGAEPLGDQDGYFQRIPFKRVIPPELMNLTIDSTEIQANELLLLSRSSDEIRGSLIYVDFGVGDDLSGAEVKDKVVLARLGSPETSGAQEAFKFAKEKREIFIAKGAKALIEVYQDRLPWKLLKNYLGAGRTVVGDTANSKLTHLVTNRDLKEVIERLKSGEELTAESLLQGGMEKSTPSSNVVAVIPGTDPELRNEYVALSAHYDHVGTRERPDRPQTAFDSVFNGARDNAFGVSALLAAAEELGAEPARRSIILVAFTAEELGLLGSKYFVENAPVPLKQIIFNLNTDGAGYNDTTIISVAGLNRVGAAEEITAAVRQFDLDTYADPAPEQGLFDRSDNVNFAAKGIPAPTMTPGFKDFDQEILQHYHQPSDEAGTLNYNYVYKFCRAFAAAARLIADKEERPRWSDGDKYEKAFKELFGE